MPRHEENLIGLKFGKLTVIKKDYNSKLKCAAWHCQCECGEYTLARTAALTSGQKTKCSVHHYDRLEGKSFNRWTVIKFSCFKFKHSRKHKYVYWLCRCECGKEKEIVSQSLTGGKSKSCGCLAHDSIRIKRGMKYNDISGEYWSRIQSQAQMREFNFTINQEYAWNLFLKQCRKCAITGVDIVLTSRHTKPKIKQTASLDRIDNTKGYIEGNVQWVHWRINNMKSNMTQLDFINWCKLVVMKDNHEDEICW